MSERASEKVIEVMASEPLGSLSADTERLRHAQNEAARCYRCGLHYTDNGFEDLIVPDGIWALISPTGEHGGLLCPNCMCAVAKERKVQCSAAFTSGPFSNHSYDRPTHALANEVTRLRALLSKAGEALGEAIVALDDWTRTVAPEFCDEARVEETMDRINEGGTLHYIATRVQSARSVSQQIKEALGE